MFLKSNNRQTKRNVKKDNLSILWMVKFTLMFAALTFALFSPIVVHAEQEQIDIIRIDNIDYVYPMEYGYARIFRGQIDNKGYPKYGKYGFIDIDGNIIVEPIYELAESFDKNGYAKVYDLWGYGLIDTTGTLIVPCEYRDVGSYSEGLVAVVTELGEMQYLDTKGSVVLSFSDGHFTGNGYMDFINGFAVLEKETGVTTSLGQPTYEYAIINKQGEFVIDFGEYSNIKRTTGGNYIVCKNQKYGLLDGNASLVVSPQWDSAYEKKSEEQFGDFYFLEYTQDGSHGLYNITYGFHILYPFSHPGVQSIKIVSDSYSIVETNTGCAIVSNFDGEWIVQPNFANIEHIHGGLFVLSSTNDDGTNTYTLFESWTKKVCLEIPQQIACVAKYQNRLYYVCVTDSNYKRKYYVCFDGDPIDSWQTANKVEVLSSMDGWEKYVFIATQTESMVVMPKGARGYVTIFLPDGCIGIFPLVGEKCIYFFESGECGVINSAEETQKVEIRGNGAFVRDEETALIWTETNSGRDYAYIDENGSYIGRAPYYFSESRVENWYVGVQTTEWLLYESDGCIGVTDRDGNIVIPAEYEKCIDRFDDAFIMEKNEEMYYLCVDGTQAKLAPSYANYELVDHQLLLVTDLTETDTEYIVMNIDGTVLIKSDEEIRRYSAVDDKGYSLLYDSSKLYFCANNCVHRCATVGPLYRGEWVLQTAEYDYPAIFQWEHEGVSYVGYTFDKNWYWNMK